MENASKALLIAGGVLLSILILTLVVLSYNNIADYFKAKNNLTKAEQIAKLNNEYTQYNRDDVRGSELLSLVNKVVDYNDREAENDDEKITIKIAIDDLTNFYYKTGKENDINYDKLQGNIVEKRRSCY